MVTTSWQQQSSRSGSGWVTSRSDPGGLPCIRQQTERRSVIQHLLMGDDTSLNKILIQALMILTEKAAAEPTARLREVTIAPMGTRPPPAESRTNGQPVWLAVWKPRPHQQCCRLEIRHGVTHYREYRKH